MWWYHSMPCNGWPRYSLVKGSEMMEWWFLLIIWHLYFILRSPEQVKIIFYRIRLLFALELLQATRQSPACGFEKGNSSGFPQFFAIFGLISLLSAPVLIGDFEISRTSFFMYFIEHHFYTCIFYLFWKGRALNDNQAEVEKSNFSGFRGARSFK